MSYVGNYMASEGQKCLANCIAKQGDSSTCSGTSATWPGCKCATLALVCPIQTWPALLTGPAASTVSPPVAVESLGRGVPLRVAMADEDCVLPTLG
jgi:hypothetical protein